MTCQSGMTCANFDRLFSLPLNAAGSGGRGHLPGPLHREENCAFRTMDTGASLISSKITWRCNCPKVHLLVRNADHLLAHNLQALRLPLTLQRSSRLNGPRNVPIGQ